MQSTVTPIQNDTFIAMFTHDLKTPINSGIFALEILLKDKSLNNYQTELLKDILNASKYMKRLTENALCKFKAESGKLSLNKEICSVKNLVENCIKETKYILKDKNQKLKFICSEENIIGNVDFVELSRVINNLISNAGKYSPKNSKIEIELNKSNKKIYFKIKDQGCGIPIDKLDKAFDKYVRLANNQKSAGTGLGLYITKLIIDAHGGKINIKSEVGKGTEIYFEIPE